MSEGSRPAAAGAARNRFALIAAIAAFGCSPAGAPETEPGSVTLGYYVGDEEGLAAIRANPSLTDVAVDLYAVRAGGGVEGPPMPELVAGLRATRGLRAWLCFSNADSGGFDAGLGAAAIGPGRDATIADLLRIARSEGYDGVDADLEGVRPESRRELSSFLAELGARLRASGLSLMVSAPAEPLDDPDNGWSGAFDYTALAESADIVQLMTYDQHGPWSEPGPVSGLDWFGACLEFALRSIPREKLLCGLPAYGYLWKEGSAGCVDVSWKDFPAATAGASVERDPASMSPRCAVAPGAGGPGVLWFEDGASVRAKVGRARALGLRGVSAWALGKETPDFWDAIAAAWR